MQKDFDLTNKPDKIENQHGLTVFDTKPKEYWDRVEKHLERDKEAAATAGKPQFKTSFQPPEVHVPISQNLHDYHATKKQGKKETTQTLEKEQWESAYTLLARTIKDDLVVGKEPFQIFLPVMRAQDKDKTFNGNLQPFKQIV